MFGALLYPDNKLQYHLKWNCCGKLNWNNLDYHHFGYAVSWQIYSETNIKCYQLELLGFNNILMLIPSGT